jgi:hypothetical protein
VGEGGGRRREAGEGGSDFITRTLPEMVKGERRGRRRKTGRRREEGGRSRKEEKGGVSPNQVNYDKPHRPCIMTDIVPSWPAFHLWKLDILAMRFPEAMIKISQVRKLFNFFFPSPVAVELALLGIT